MPRNVIRISIILGIITVSVQQNQANHLAHIRKLLDELTVSTQLQSKETYNERDKYHKHDEYSHYNDKRNEMNIHKLKLFKQNRQLDDIRSKSFREEVDIICRVTGRCGCSGSRCGDRNDATIDTLIENIFNSNNEYPIDIIKDLHETLKEYLRNNGRGNIDMTSLKEAHRMCIEQGKCRCTGHRCRGGHKENFATNDKMPDLIDTSEELLQSNNFKNDYDSEKMLIKDNSKKGVDTVIHIYIIDDFHGTHRLNNIQSPISIKRNLGKVLHKHKHKTLAKKPLVKLTSKTKVMSKQKQKRKLEKIRKKKLKTDEVVTGEDKDRVDNISEISQYNNKLTNAIANYIYGHYINNKVARNGDSIEKTIAKIAENLKKYIDKVKEWLKKKLNELNVEENNQSDEVNKIIQEVLY